MKSKKGVSPLLAAVLLVALAVTMATIVSTFVIKQAKEFDPNQLADQSLYCESVSLGFTVADVENLKIYSQGGVDPTSGKAITAPRVFLFSPITIINRGAFSIHQLIINAPGINTAVYPIFDKKGNLTILKPGAENKYNISIQIQDPKDQIKSTQINIVPVIKDPEKNQFIRCTDRQLIIDYKQVCHDLNIDPAKC